MFQIVYKGSHITIFNYFIRKILRRAICVCSGFFFGDGIFEGEENRQTFLENFMKTKV